MDEKAAEDDAKAAKDRKGAKVVEARRRLTRALRVDKSIEEVEVRDQGVRTPGED